VENCLIETDVHKSKPNLSLITSFLLPEYDFLLVNLQKWQVTGKNPDLTIRLTIHDLPICC
jgi:hypothetical protein